MNFLDLLEENESEYLDFKSEWHKHPLELVYDILCMANSDATGDRYIIIGVRANEKTHKKTFHSITKDKNRKNHEELCKLLLDNKINRLPNIQIEQLKFKSKTLDIIIIKNTPYKPYFLLETKKYTKSTEETKNKQDKTRSFHAGVVYSRNGSTNTPINSTAPEHQIAKMWEERFGLTLPPIKRLEKYVYDTNNWDYYDDEQGKSIAFYKPFPEFTAFVTEADRRFPCSKEGWLNTVGDSYECNIIFKYHATIIKKLTAALVDNSRYIAVTPERYDVFYTEDLSEVVLWHYFAAVPNGYTQDELCCLGKFQQRAMYYHIKDSFEWTAMHLFNGELSLKHFYISCGFPPFDKVYLFSKFDNIEKICRQLFINEMERLNERGLTPLP